jgi:hypothetical protein
MDPVTAYLLVSGLGFLGDFFGSKEKKTQTQTQRTTPTPNYQYLRDYFMEKYGIPNSARGPSVTTGMYANAETSPASYISKILNQGSV